MTSVTRPGDFVKVTTATPTPVFNPVKRDYDAYTFRATVIYCTKRILAITTIAIAAIILVIPGTLLLCGFKIYRWAIIDTKKMRHDFRMERDQMKNATRFIRFQSFAGALAAFKKLDSEASPLKSEIESLTCKRLQKNLRTIIQTIENAQAKMGKTDLHKANDTIIDHLEEALSSDGYWEDLNSITSRFLTELCFQLYMQDDYDVDNTKAMFKFSKFIAGKADIAAVYGPGRTDLSHIADAIERGIAYSEKCSHERNTFLGTIEWAVSHPFRLLNALKGEFDFLGDYSVHKTGNPIIHFHSHTINGAEVQHILAGSPTKGNHVSPILYGFINALKGRRKFLFEINLQAPHGGEYPRTKALLALNNCPFAKDKMRVIADAVNGKRFEKGQLLQGKPFDLDSHTEAVQNLVKYMPSEYRPFNEGTGHFVPEEYEPEVKAAAEKSKAILRDHSTRYFKGLSDAEKSQVQQYLFQFLKNMGILETLSKTHKNIVFIEHCKEDIDRGAAKNFLFSLVQHMKQEEVSEQVLSEEALCETLAPIFTRAQAANDRTILRKHVKPLVNLLRSVTKEGLLL